MKTCNILLSAVATIGRPHRRNSVRGQCVRRRSRRVSGAQQVDHPQGVRGRSQSGSIRSAVQCRLRWPRRQEQPSPMPMAWPKPRDGATAFPDLNITVDKQVAERRSGRRALDRARDQHRCRQWHSGDRSRSANHGHDAVSNGGRANRRRMDMRRFAWADEATGPVADAGSGAGGRRQLSSWCSLTQADAAPRIADQVRSQKVRGVATVASWMLIVPTAWRSPRQVWRAMVRLAVDGGCWNCRSGENRRYKTRQRIIPNPSIAAVQAMRGPNPIGRSNLARRRLQAGRELPRYGNAAFRRRVTPSRSTGLRAARAAPFQLEPGPRSSLRRHRRFLDTPA